MKALSFLISLFLVMAMPFTISAETGNTSSGSVTAEITDALTNPLAVKAVKVTDDMHVRVVFSEPTELATVKLKLVKQSDNSNIEIESLTGVELSIDSVDIILSEQLEEGNAYTITTISAVGISGATITDGALAIKDFITPVPLKKSIPVVLSAAPQKIPEPKKVEDSTQSGNTNIASGSDANKEKVVSTEELPLTGMNPLFLILLALPLAAIALRKRL